MRTRPVLPTHVEITPAAAAGFAADPDFGLTSVPAEARRGHLDLGSPGARVAATFWPADDHGHRAVAGDEVLAAEWAAFAVVSPADSRIEIAVGRLGHHDLHWRMVDVLRLAGQDVGGQSTRERQALLLELYRMNLAGGRHLRLARRELALLATDDNGKQAYAAEGPGRAGDRLAFRRLAAPYDEPWLVAPLGWTTRA